MKGCPMSSSALSAALLFCLSTKTLERYSWRWGRKERSTWMTKVCLVDDSATPLTGFQVKRSITAAGPGMQEL